MAKSKKYLELVERLKKAQYIDDKELFTYANIKKCPDKIWGMVFISLKGENLYIFDADYSGPKGEPIYVIPVKEMTNVKFPHRLELLLFGRAKFTYNSFEYAFQAGLVKNTPICNAIMEIRGEA